jgi:hypothetical protein
MSSTLESLADHCVLGNPVFSRLGTGSFRRAESDGAPVMVVALGDNIAALPLRSLQREFGIEDESPDGRMLVLIAESLDFVAGLNIGDPLPSEVLSGRASWRPASKHLQVAAARLRLQLLNWIDPAAAAGEAGQPPSIERMENDPALRAAVQRAFEQAARELALAGPQAVMELLAEIADELSYIEALRETFMRRVQSMVNRLDGLSNGVVNMERKTVLSRIRRLAHIALGQIAGRFSEVDEQTGEVLTTLRHVERHRSFIRAHRDWLYRSSRAWEPILTEWDSAMPGLDDATWARLNRTYQFLAPRFMPVQEWFSSAAQNAARRAKKPDNVMVW